MKSYYLVAILALGVFALPPSTAEASLIKLSGFGTPSIDGVFSPGEWDSSGQVDLSINLPQGELTSGRLFVMNDTVDLCTALKFERDFVDPGNSLFFEFESDRYGVKDIFGYNPESSRGFFDDVRNGPYAPLDTYYGGTIDGYGAFHNDGSYSVYEMCHPLWSGDEGNDFSLTINDELDFKLHLRIMDSSGVWPEGTGDTYYSATVLIEADPEASAVVIIRVADSLGHVKTRDFRAKYR